MTLSPTLVGFACVAALGCHARREHVDKSYFGTKVVPPGVLAKIRPGMTLAEVTAVAPGLREVPLRGFLVASAGGAKQYVVMADGIVAETYVALEGDDATPAITAAWGPPSPRHDRDDPVWRGADTGWRATLRCGHGSKAMPVAPACTLTFHPHRPAAELFTKAIGPGGVLAAIKPDATFAEAVAATRLPLSDHRDFKRTSDFDGATESVSFIGRQLRITYFIHSETPKSVIDAAWGPAVARDANFETWVDPVTGWRAVCDCDDKSMYITFSSYWPMPKLLTTLEMIAASADLATARTAHPELGWDSEGNGFTVPDSDRGGVTSVSVRERDHHLIASTILHAENTDARDRTVNELASRWGHPKSTTEGDEVTYRYPQHGTLTVLDHMMVLEVK